MFDISRLRDNKLPLNETERDLTLSRMYLPVGDIVFKHVSPQQFQLKTGNQVEFSSVMHAITATNRIGLNLFDWKTAFKLVKLVFSTRKSIAKLYSVLSGITYGENLISNAYRLRNDEMLMSKSELMEWVQTIVIYTLKKRKLTMSAAEQTCTVMIVTEFFLKILTHPSYKTIFPRITEEIIDYSSILSYTSESRDISYESLLRALCVVDFDILTLLAMPTNLATILKDTTVLSGLNLTKILINALHASVLTLPETIHNVENITPAILGLIAILFSIKFENYQVRELDDEATLANRLRNLWVSPHVKALMSNYSIVKCGNYVLNKYPEVLTRVKSLLRIEYPEQTLEEHIRTLYTTVISNEFTQITGWIWKPISSELPYLGSYISKRCSNGMLPGLGLLLRTTNVVGSPIIGSMVSSTGVIKMDQFADTLLRFCHESTSSLFKMMLSQFYSVERNIKTQGGLYTNLNDYEIEHAAIESASSLVLAAKTFVEPEATYSLSEVISVAAKEFTLYYSHNTQTPIAASPLRTQILTKDPVTLLIYAGFKTSPNIEGQNSYIYDALPNIHHLLSINSTFQQSFNATPFGFHKTDMNILQDYEFTFRSKSSALDGLKIMLPLQALRPGLGPIVREEVFFLTDIAKMAVQLLKETAEKRIEPDENLLALLSPYEREIIETHVNSRIKIIEWTHFYKFIQLLVTSLDIKYSSYFPVINDAVYTSILSGKYRHALQINDSYTSLYIKLTTTIIKLRIWADIVRWLKLPDSYDSAIDAIATLIESNFDGTLQYAQSYDVKINTTEFTDFYSANSPLNSKNDFDKL